MGYTKLVQTGRVIEIYEYQKEPYISVSKRFNRRMVRRYRGYKDTRDDGRGKERRSDSANRAKKSFRRLVHGNISQAAPALLTLTMLDIVDIRDAYKCYTSFGLRIKRAYGQMVSWIAVPEFQKRGAVHFHVLIWGLPYEAIKYERTFRDIAGFWGKGFVDIVQTDGSARLAIYLSKYMSKAMSDNRLFGQKAYSSTRNIVRPVSIVSVSAIDIITAEFQLNVIHSPYLQYEVSYPTLWLGRCDYKRYVVT